MPKGSEQSRDAKKKPKLTLKEKRLRKKEKKMQQRGDIHEVRDVYQNPEEQL